MIRVCPLPAALTTIPTYNCGVQFDQIVKIVFQRRQSAASFTTATIKLLATWTPLLAAVGNTKVQGSPVFTSMVIPPSEGLFAGGNDNGSFNGIPDYNGEGPVTVTGSWKNLPANVAKVLDDYVQESLPTSVGKSNLTAYFVNKDGMIISNNYFGFDIFNFRIGSVGSEGFNAKNVTPFSFTLLPLWDRNAVMDKPTDFDPLTQL